MELILPKNYVEIEQEEMVYLDGGGVGYHWWNKAQNVGTSLGQIMANVLDRLDGRYDGYLWAH